MTDLNIGLVPSVSCAPAPIAMRATSVKYPFPVTVCETDDKYHLSALPSSPSDYRVSRLPVNSLDHAPRVHLLSKINAGDPAEKVVKHERRHCQKRTRRPT